ncbi:MAG: ligase-associated DNA damage response endonuclease PdeM [Maribacter sp.]|nr:ligase-associated DNA damage response endonuclease PdeM [Maribacter sp.]NNK18320.1 ligase-associated DNA damage response endonuclease PdeM [Maribacter sp.]
MTQDIQIHGQSFTLHPSGSLFWQEKSALLISDVHLGKISHFRKYGAAVPLKAIHANFQLMDEAIAFFNPSTIYFLGDLFHSHLNSEWSLFEKWTLKYKCEIILISGNHDIISPLKYEALGIKIIDDLIEEDFLLTHHPVKRKDFFNFCGHIHPAVKIRGNGKQSLRLPCFFKSQNQMILPAFGEFTGSFTLKPTKKDQVFAIGDGMIIKI